MSTYKVIQDIEAEDKLIGPLSFRQFAYGLISAFSFYISFLCASHKATFLLIVFLPPALISGFFAFPFGKDQPTEIWALAKIRFYFKPRRRVWDQSGVKELVTITVPKKVEEVRTDGLSQNEVQSRLSALANTIDSRGWAVKNVNLNLSAPTNGMVTSDDTTDRLITAAGLPQTVPTDDIQASDDILDEQNNPIAQQFEQMINASTQAHRQQIREMMDRQAPEPMTANQPAPTAAPVAGPASDWFMQSPLAQVSPVATTAVMPTAEEELIARRLKVEQAAQGTAYGRLKTIQPIDLTRSSRPMPSPNPTATPVAAPSQLTAEPMTPYRKPAILELANNNDLNVATLARQAKKSTTGAPDDGEVVIALR